MRILGSLPTSSSGSRSLNASASSSNHSMSSNGAFKWSGEKDVTKAEIPCDYSSIGENAFLECSSLTNITIPNSITEIG